jgi:hypothetical protein
MGFYGTEQPRRKYGVDLLICLYGMLTRSLFLFTGWNQCITTIGRLFYSGRLARRKGM